ncbi:unnamed protein product (macronuclear) [Paramecium tetraurelia]|uniref:Arginase n=1 Tax=Paramecium tetraurelia TaxID=5888 RepID=A0D2U6_PARTE|nr:uncharacterized protein GSPATT00012871001 [Paramecium tetraurelia]CAK77363.1 unnamed protein product [Paramecium tetraurelia]|eukprot:XP_001444760.1 hypothetical protein (macronuclear) [Paramecium tetraurelia strain d4-2]
MSDDPRFKIVEGIDGDYVIIGFPHHIGAKRDNVRIGQDHGPDSLRRFLPRIGPLRNAEYMKDISNFIVSDYGNIHVDDDQNLEKLLEKLNQKVKIVHNKNHIPIVIGGSKDCVFGVLSDDLHVISINHIPDIQVPYDGNKPSINSGLRASTSKISITYFGYDNSKLNQEQENYINEKCNGISLQKIRQAQKAFHQDLEQQVTQAGILFKQILTNLQGKRIHISISLEAIDSAFCPGVSRPCVQGLQVEEIFEIVYLAGKFCVGLDITDYNPTIEDYRTGFLLGNLIYYFILSKGKDIK